MGALWDPALGGPADWGGVFRNEDTDELEHLAIRAFLRRVSNHSYMSFVYTSLILYLGGSGILRPRKGAHPTIFLRKKGYRGNSHGSVVLNGEGNS